MASFHPILSLLLLFMAIPISSAAIARILFLVKPEPMILKYHNGPLLKGNVPVNLIWYGKFSRAQMSIIVDFIHSLNPKYIKNPPQPSAASWWATTSKYKTRASVITVGKQIFDVKCSLGRSLNDSQIATLASKVNTPNSINVVLTAANVVVEDFCMNRCGVHGSEKVKKGRHHERFVYAWVGNSASQCPALCAWPFHKPIVGPQTPPLKAPNGDVGADGMIINLATILAGTVTNPFDSGFFQGPASAPLEAVSACTGIFGSGAFPGYPGKLLIDKKTGASYNAHGVNGRKYLVPAMWDPPTKTCKTLV